jgi:hypothetical protein
VPTGYIGNRGAEGVVQKHLAGIFYRATIKLTETVLIEDATPPRYTVTGVITPESRNVITRFLSPCQPYTFTASVDAVEGKMLGYEVV